MVSTGSISSISATPAARPVRALQIFQVRAAGLRADFPPLRTMDAVPGNLPVQATSFVGRDVEVKELTDLVRAHRLVTLTGVGGVGKTRLAVQVAAELAAEFADGVWLVELAPVGDPAAVPDVVATALGVTAQAGLTVTDSIAQALSGRRLLIVLDNCEHVLDAAADAGRDDPGPRRDGDGDGDLAGGPAGSAPSTCGRSRRSTCTRGRLSGGGVVRRTRPGRDPDFTLDEADDVDAVTEICRRLDGIALAIELAAARMVSMSPQDVRDRLDDRFRLLSGTRRGSERHQTLRHAVQWSYDLLDDDERARAGCCSVFADGFDAGCRHRHLRVR